MSVDLPEFPTRRQRLMAYRIYLPTLYLVSNSPLTELSIYQRGASVDSKEYSDRRDQLCFPFSTPCGLLPRLCLFDWLNLGHRIYVERMSLNLHNSVTFDSNNASDVLANVLEMIELIVGPIRPLSFSENTCPDLGQPKLWCQLSQL